MYYRPRDEGPSPRPRGGQGGFEQAAKSAVRNRRAGQLIPHSAIRIPNLEGGCGAGAILRVARGPQGRRMAAALEGCNPWFSRGVSPVSSGGMPAAERLSVHRKKMVDNGAGCLIRSRRFAALKNRGVENRRKYHFTHRWTARDRCKRQRGDVKPQDATLSLGTYRKVHRDQNHRA